MRSKVLLGVLLTSGLFSLATGTGCGDGGSTSGGEGGAGSTVSSSSVGPVSSSSSSMFTPDTNVDCDTAEALALDVMAVPGSLEPVFEDADYYVFEGTKGLAIVLETDSKLSSDEFDQTFPDTVITLKMKDDQGNWVDIAQNDDPYPLPTGTNDASMYTVLPADGTYCLEVAECSKVFGVQNCRAPTAPDILITDYTVLGGALITDPATLGISNETAMEPTDTAATIDYRAAMTMPPNQLFTSTSWGSFASATDKDMWAFKTPAMVSIDPGTRAGCHFEFYLPGTEGNGSSADKNVTAYVVSAADPMKKIAAIDPTIYDTTFGRQEPMSISVPCTLDTDYFFVMERTMGAAAGKNDFYFFNHYVVGANPVEVGPNDDIAMPEVLKPTPNQSKGSSFFVDGDFEKDGDVDYYSAAVPAGATTITVVCESERGGSAVRGLKVTPLDSKDMPIPAGKGSLVEGPQKQLTAYDQAIPAGTTTVKFKVEPTSLDPNIESKFYRCGFHLNPPAAP